MGWSTSAPSGVNFPDSTETTKTKTWNHWKLTLTVWTGRKKDGGNTFYLKVKAKWGTGSQGDYQNNPPFWWYTTSGSESASEKEQQYNRPDSAGGTQYRYYTGTRGSSGNVTVGLSLNASHISYDTLAVSTDLAAATYAVTYNANGGAGSTAAQSKTYGKTLTLRANGFTRNGYTFTGWNTAAGGTGTAYAEGGAYTGNAAVVLYAQWVQTQTPVPAYANASGTIRTGSAISVNAGAAVKDAELWANVGGTVRKF